MRLSALLLLVLLALTVTAAVEAMRASTGGKQPAGLVARPAA